MFTSWYGRQNLLLSLLLMYCFNNLYLCLFTFFNARHIILMIKAARHSFLSYQWMKSLYVI